MARPTQPSPDAAATSTSLIKFDTEIPTRSDPLALEPSFTKAGFSGSNHFRGEYDDFVDHDTHPASGAAPLSDVVIGLREWGAGRVFSLRAPQHPREAAMEDIAALQ